MNAEYLNEDGDYEPCKLLACSISTNKVLIELDGDVGWCSASLVMDDLKD
mgnify:CR=1 FL=1